MPDNPNVLSILSQLDGFEKSDIITDEELEEIGAAYGSKEKYEETMRGLASCLSGTQARRGDVYVPVGDGRKGPRIKAGTSTVPLGNIPKVKRINIVGKIIASAGDAAQLFSAFRDPRIEIFNIAYTSKSGKVLVHTAWTLGLPGLASAVYGKTPDAGFQQIQKIKYNLDADKIWIAHNHPSGNSEPSNEDIGVTKRYSQILKESFGGHIVLDHTEYSLLEGYGSFTKHNINFKTKNYLGKRRETAHTVSTPEIIALSFRKILTNNENTSVISVLDGRNRIISWNYFDTHNINDIKKYIRAAGGYNAIALTNNILHFEKYRGLSNKVSNTKDDVFLDVILLNRQTGQIEKTHAHDRLYPGGNWQWYESKKIHFITKNKTNQTELEFDQTDNFNSVLNASSTRQNYKNKENTMSDVMELEKLPIDVWIRNKSNNRMWLSHAFKDKVSFFKLEEDPGDYGQERQGGEIFVSFYSDLHSAQNDLSGYGFIVNTVPDINTAKTIIGETISHFDHMQNINGLDDYLDSQISRYYQNLIASDRAQYDKYVKGLMNSEDRAQY